MSSALSADAPTAATTVPDYAQFYANFSADSIAAELSGNLQTGINACVECCDRHATPGRIALFWEGKDGRSATYTFAQLKELSGRFANFLKAQGVQPGDRVAGLLPRTPELLIAILGTWRAGAVYQPLFTAFGSKSIEYRVAASEARLIVTDTDNRHKLEEVPDCPSVMIVAADNQAQAGDFTGDFNFWAELDRQPTEFAPVMRKADDAFIMLFTSGTTGPAKGVAVPLRAMLAFYVYTRYAMDVRPEDAFWNIADPGWAYGLYYCVTGPLLMGHAITLYEGSFTVESTYRIIDKYKITNLAGSPTAYRMLIAGGEAAAAPVKGRLRAVSSAGEPLNPEVIRWFREHLDCLINDHYGQTETGMVLCNHHGLKHEVHMGSAGLAMPGYRLAVLDDDQRELGIGEPGVLAVDRRHSPVYWFQGYWQQDTDNGNYYVTGDTVEKNQDGSISFIGRGDDIITSSGYRIGPFDVESALLEHPAVVEAAVVGKPDPERTELVKAFVVLSKDYQASAELIAELQQYVKHRLAAHSYPREIEFLTELPKTPSGKLQRFILRNQEVAKSKM